MTNETVAIDSPEASPRQTKFDDFEVERSGRTDCSFKITNAELRTELMNWGLLREPEKNIALIEFLSQVDDPDSYFNEIRAPNAKIDALIEVAKQQRVLLAKYNAGVKERGVVSFMELLTAYEPGDLVVVSEEDVQHGAAVSRVTRHETPFGVVAEFCFRFVSFDGNKFIYVEQSMFIREFAGRSDTRALGFELMKPEHRPALIARGRRFIELNEQRTHAQYAGNITRRSWQFGPSYYRADGRIIVDVKSLRKLEPNYAPYYGNFPHPHAGAYSANVGDLADENTLALCSPFVYGFSFAAKVWGEMHVDTISPVQYRTDAFDKVVLEADRKRLIKALVSSEFTEFSDIVDGKGSGCIFLLAGKPGVGKTVTAEALAESLGKPLYIVGAGELGTSAVEVEAKLRQVLDVAALWNAVLLIDECDIFLEKRKKNDIHRNAVVAIFLRMLEYYSGILFLTTNRVKELDKAFLSRISVALYYHKLGFKKRLKVWTGLSQKHDFSDLDFDKLAEHKLNGREIKSALKLALALAKSEGRKPAMADIEHVIHFGDQFRAVGIGGRKKRR